MARPRRQIYALKDYLEKNRTGNDTLNGDILNDADTQRNPAYKAIIDGLVVTVLTDDYIPSIILAEEDNTQLHIADGGSRTAALMMFKYGNYKIKKSTENSVIKYKKKVQTDDGIKLEDAEFDIKGKSFDQLPVELQKKFDEYQIETVIHEHCDREKLSMYIKRYNQHSGMNTNQKMFTNVPRFAHQIRLIAQRPFFVNSCTIKDIEKEKGVLERIITEAVMCMTHFDKWSKQGNKIASFVNNNASKEEFDLLNSNLERLENIITDDTKCLFNSKDAFVWITAFNLFTKYGLDDSKFGEFLNAFVNGLRDNNVDGKFFDDIDKTGSTKDKKNISEKLDIIESLMKDFLHIDEKVCDVEDDVADIPDDGQSEETLLKDTSKSKNFDAENTKNEREKRMTFIATNVALSLNDVKSNMDMYEDTLEDLKNNCIKIESNLLDRENEPSLLALVAYSYKHDVDLDNWMEEYGKKHDEYLFDQSQNYRKMKSDFEKYLNRIGE